MKYDFNSIIAKLSLVLLSVLVGLFFCEVISREFLPSKSPAGETLSYDLAREVAPYTMIKGLSTEENPQGYRGKPPSAVKPAGEKWIFILGGSTVYYGDPPLSAILEKLIREKANKNYKVFNYGIPSSKSGEELARLVFDILDHSPDIIIFYDGANDINDPHGDPRPGYPFNFLTYEKNPIMIKDVTEYPTLQLLAYGSHFLRYFFYNKFVESFLDIEQLRKKHDYHEKSWMEKATSIYHKNVHKAALLTKAYHAQFFHFFQPMKNFDDFYRKTGTTIYDEKVQHEDPVLYGRKLVLDKFSNDKQIFFTDLSNLFNREDPEAVYVDPVHLKQDYFQPVAESIFAVIRKKL